MALSCVQVRIRRSSSSVLPPRPDLPMSIGDDEHWLVHALREAELAIEAGEIPVAAIVVRDGREIARASNRTVRDQDPTAHAETLAIRAASAALGQWRLDGC